MKFTGGGRKRVAFWPGHPSLLRHHDRDSEAEAVSQLLSCPASTVPMAPAPSGEEVVGQGALPTPAPFLVTGLGLSTPWQGGVPTGGTCPQSIASCNHWKHFIFHPWMVLGCISSFPCTIRKAARDYNHIEEVPNNLKNKRFPAHRPISTRWEKLRKCPENIQGHT